MVVNNPRDLKKVIRLDEKYRRLKRIIAGYDRVWVAFSGGLDSTFLLALTHIILGDRVTAVTAKTPFQPRRDSEAALEKARALGVKQIWFELDLLNDIKVQLNSRDRCYHCKKSIFSTIRREASQKGITHILDGSHLDDLNEYRPGRKALQEIGILSPLREAGLTKPEIRLLARQMELPGWSEPAQSCLATRFPYGEPISRAKLNQVEKAEEILRKSGFRQFRVRSHDNLARIEVEPEDMGGFFQPGFRDYISRSLLKLGFTYVTLDLQGFRSGSMDLFKQENRNG